MFADPMEIADAFPVRKSKKQKQAFREAVQSYARSLGYPVTMEKGSLGAQNVILGDPEGADYLVTAHYDTPARMLVPNFLTPCNFPVYLAYQILVVAGMFIIAFLAGLLSGVALKAPELGGTVAGIVYWSMLILLLFGPANPHNRNDNTSGVVTLLEMARTLPENQRGKVCFVLFDLEEAGLVGSSSYRKAHKKSSDSQMVLNLDCVGDGDHIRLFPTKKLKKDREKLAPLYDICGYFGTKDILVVDKGFAAYPSDQAKFPYGVGIAAFHKKKGLGLYVSRIHTPMDTVLETTNVNLIRAALTTLITKTK